jgi:hypothetical protein
MESMQISHHIQAKNKATHKSTIGSYTRSKYCFGVHNTTIPQPTRLAPKHLDETRSKGLCFNCDNKYNKGHKCDEKKLFYIECEEEEY